MHGILDDAQRFLAALDPNANTFCFQTFDDHKERRDGKLARALHGVTTYEELKYLNGRGAGVFVTVNAIKTGAERKIENLGPIRAVWQDDDTGWTGAYPLAPSIVVQSSFGKYQRYWAADGLSADLHQALMRRLVADHGADPNVHDLVRVLRVPGFFHLKNPDAPFLVTLVEASGLIYTADEIASAFPPIWPEPEVKTSPANRGIFDSHEFDRLIEALAFIPADERHVWFRVGAALKLEFGDTARDLWDGWSATSPKFDPKSQHRVWRSIRRNSGASLGTIYYLARRHGFHGDHRS